VARSDLTFNAREYVSRELERISEVEELESSNSVRGYPVMRQ
jgi:hypothetical protein